MSYNDPRNPTPDARDATRRRWSVHGLAQAVSALLRTRAFLRLVLATPVIAIMTSIPVVLPKLRSDPSRIRARYERLALQSLAADDEAPADEIG